MIQQPSSSHPHQHPQQPSLRLSIARAQHVSTLLDDGSILVTGGVSENLRPLDQAERLNPAGARSTPIAGRHLPRTWHRAVKLADGRVVLVGGTGADGKPERRIEVFDPRSGAFSLLGNLETARAKHGAALLPDGKILVVGGSDDRGSALNSAEIIDPAARTVAKLQATMSARRYDLQATPLADGRVLITGGAGDERSRSSAEIYDPARRAFLPPIAMSAPRVVHTATRLEDGKVLTFANGVGELFVPPNQFTRVPGTGGPAIRDGHTATLLSDNRVLIVGGGVPDFSDNLLGAPILYDARNNSYMALEQSDASVNRADHSAVLTREGTVLILGGRTLNSHATHDVYTYDPATRTFRGAQPLVASREP